MENTAHRDAVKVTKRSRFNYQNPLQIDLRKPSKLEVELRSSIFQAHSTRLLKSLQKELNVELEASLSLAHNLLSMEEDFKPLDSLLILLLKL